MTAETEKPKRLIVTAVEPAVQGKHPSEDKLGKVLECFELPFDVVEIVLCEDEICFITSDGRIIDVVDSELADLPCPRCGVAPGTLEQHTCKNPLEAKEQL